MSNQTLSAATRGLLDELSLTLPVDLENIAGEWNGDESGNLEDRATIALSALDNYKQLLEDLEELGN